MDRSELLRHVDHTLLRPDATAAEIRQLCDEALKYNTASVCVPPSYVGTCARYLQGRIKVCTVIGFPNGYNSLQIKVLETAEAIKNGADEIDMVINVGYVKDGQWGLVMDEILAVKKECDKYKKLLKVIIETCLLTDKEKERMCRMVTQAKVDYIKTSTGFSSGGATREDVALLVANVGAGVKVKASGGISTLQDAEDFLALGADRLGTSKVVKLIMAEENK